MNHPILFKTLASVNQFLHSLCQYIHCNVVWNSNPDFEIGFPERARLWKVNNLPFCKIKILGYLVDLEVFQNNFVNIRRDKKLFCADFGILRHYATTDHNWKPVFGLRRSQNGYFSWKLNSDIFTITAIVYTLERKTKF